MIRFWQLWKYLFALFMPSQNIGEGELLGPGIIYVALLSLTHFGIRQLNMTSLFLIPVIGSLVVKAILETIFWPIRFTQLRISCVLGYGLLPMLLFPIIDWFFVLSLHQRVLLSAIFVLWCSIKAVLMLLGNLPAYARPIWNGIYVMMAFYFVLTYNLIINP